MVNTRKIPNKEQEGWKYSSSPQATWKKENMKIKELIEKLKKLEKTESGEVSFKIITRGGKKISYSGEGDILTEVNLFSCENADEVFTEIIFEKWKEKKGGSRPQARTIVHRPQAVFHVKKKNKGGSRPHAPLCPRHFGRWSWI